MVGTIVKIDELGLINPKSLYTGAGTHAVFSTITMVGFKPYLLSMSLF